MATIVPGDPTPLLEVRDISKTFPGVKALDGVSLTLNRGEILGLCGENGAGKSTLMKILTGIYEPDEGGEVRFDGKPSKPRNPREAYEQGLVIVHQELHLVPDLTVAQNIFIGRERKSLGGLGIDDRGQVAEARRLLSRLGIRLDPAALVGNLSVADRQMVEIARALSFDARVIILDEPTAPLSTDEAEALFRVIREFRNENTGVIYISHRLEEVLDLCDRITVLRDGQSVGTREAGDLTHKELISKMVGREVSGDLRPPQRNPGEVVLEVKGLSTRELLDDVSFELRRGEILGLAGLVGAGRTEVARAIVGADHRSAGEIRVRGRKIAIANPADAVDAGIGYLSEDRKGAGLLLTKSVKDNVALSSLDRHTKVGVIDDRTLATIAKGQVKALAVKTPSVEQQTQFLSGGNQQKVIIGRWLVRDCDILIFDEPTRGIDVGAKEEIYAILNDLVAAGKSLIVISSELPEVLRLADRVAVMSEGRLAGILENADATPERVMQLATRSHTSVMEDVQ
ncbi:sugar ABC transporter ATP-binding protein [Georgenia yuyongxinii]